MKQPFQNILLGLAISLILTAFSANADTSKTTTSQVRYGYYYRFNDSAEQMYHRFLPHPAPEECFYQTRIAADVNIDDTPEKETVVLIVVGSQSRADFSKWHQAFLLITNTKARKLEKKAFFKLFDTGAHPLKVPAAKTIELHRPPFGLKQPTDVSFRLVDMTDDGTLDVWVESEHGVALISFHNGAFKEVFSRYTVTKKKLSETPEIAYYGYNVPSDPEGEKYHRFLAAPAPEGLYYNTRMKAVANIDDTPEKENIVLMVADTGRNGPHGEWVQAFLLITEDETDGAPKKKDLFKLFDAGTHDLDVPGKNIEVRNPPFVFEGLWRGEPWNFTGVGFELVDLTGDGILDVWVDHAHGVAVISFQNGEFKEVCSGYAYSRKHSPAYVDLDNDGTYEIKIPRSIFMIDNPPIRYLQWMSLYEWDGTAYVLNNERIYAENDAFLIRLLRQYNAALILYGRYEPYSFYIGLVFYYRGNTAMARRYLQSVVKHAEKQAYSQAAESLLKKLPPQ